MKQRVLTSIAIIVTMLLLGVFSATVVYPIALGLAAIVAVFEILRVMGSHKRLLLSVPAYLISCALPIVAYFINREQQIMFLLAIAASLFVYMMWLMGVSVFSRGKTPFSRISEVFCAVTYVSVSFTSLCLLRYQNEKYGLFVVVLAFLIPWICDVFAFFTGTLIGKHKLIPEVSPKKTVEGSIGGIIFAAIACGVYGLGLDLIFADIKVNYVVLIAFGALLSVVSQLGDLVASLIKREYGAKDYGNIFPGHGGIMDRLDSVLATSTILLILTIIFPPFTQI